MKSQKVTNAFPTPTRRRYEDACGAAHALDLVGERWALLVMRELMFGPKRFSDLRSDLPGISANVLTQRLEGLEQAGVLLRRKLPPPASAQVYELTSWGYESEPIFQALGRWAVRSPTHDAQLPLSGTSLIMSFRTMVHPDRLDGLEARIGVDFGKERFTLLLRDGQIKVERGEISNADAVLSGAPEVIAAAVYAGEPIERLEGRKALAITGDRQLIQRFLALFSLPPKVEQ